jgi:hypothetical protein
VSAQLAALLRGSTAAALHRMDGNRVARTADAAAAQPLPSLLRDDADACCFGRPGHASAGAALAAQLALLAVVEAAAATAWFLRC